MKYSIGLKTDPGPKTRNEDTMLAVVPTEQRDTVLLVVADGMGGANAGDLASREAVNVLHAQLIEKGAPERDTAAERLVEAIKLANVSVYEHSQSSPDLDGMGSTVVAALILKDSFWVAHVGDSRAYLIRGGEPRQITEDHTWVRSQVRDGKITQEQADRLHMNHVLDRALGPDSAVNVDVWADDTLEPGDVLVLCSDGLSGVVTPERIAAVVADNTAQQAAETLVNIALAEGTRDNVSAIVFRFH
ncbi:MAG: serine/threonine-protein phosphatase [Chloroflexi bacterium]|nr:serine/threonine-protein phosphatase [Chloroflexota bacterium]